VDEQRAKQESRRLGVSLSDLCVRREAELSRISAAVECDCSQRLSQEGVYGDACENARSVAICWRVCFDGAVRTGKAIWLAMKVS